jgi:hypothetical protein
MKSTDDHVADRVDVIIALTSEPLPRRNGEPRPRRSIAFGARLVETLLAARTTTTVEGVLSAKQRRDGVVSWRKAAWK